LQLSLRRMLVSFLFNRVDFGFCFLPSAFPLDIISIPYFKIFTSTNLLYFCIVVARVKSENARVIVKILTKWYKEKEPSQLARPFFRKEERQQTVNEWSR